MKLKFAKIDANAISPTRAHPGDAGLDLYALSYEYKDGYYDYKFGIAVEIPEGFVGLIAPRSSICNKDLMLTNHIGILDSTFRGPLSARFKELPHKDKLPRIYKVGERVAQLVVVAYSETVLLEVPYDKLSKTERDIGGFGSSGP